MEAYSFTNEVIVTLLSLWDTVVGVLPRLIGAAIIVIIGFIVAPVLGGIVKRVIDVFRVDEVARRVGVHDMLKGYSNSFSISLLFGKLVKWFFILAFSMAAAEVLNWSQVTAFLNSIIFYIPSVLIAIIFLLLAIIAGKFFESIVIKSIKGSKAPVEKPEVLGMFTRWSFIVFGVFAALVQLGIAEALIIILFAGLVLSMALSFGLGGRKKAEEILGLIKIHGCGCSEGGCGSSSCGVCHSGSKKSSKKTSKK